jgi:hypothetical protein
MADRVLIVGNGISRLAYQDDIAARKGEVWACNYAFREFPDIITRLTGHDFALVDAQKAKDERGYRYRIFSGPMASKPEGWELFTVPPKWHRDSGTTLVAQALHEDLDVDLVGFDLGGPDVHAHKQYQQDKTAWIHRWAEIVEEWGSDRLHFIGYDHLPFIRSVILDPLTAKAYARAYKARRPHIDTAEYRKIHMEVIMADKEKPAEPAKRVKYMDTDHIAVVSAAVAAIYKLKDPDGKKYRILGDVRPEEAPKPKAAAKEKAAAKDEE